MAILFRTASFPETDSSLLVTPMENLTFDELHRLCECENIVMVEGPIFSFNFHTMKLVSGSDPVFPLKFVSDALIKSFSVSMEGFEKMDDFYKKHLSEKDIVFFYSGVKVNGTYNLRFFKLEYDKVESAIRRYEAVTRLNRSFNIKNTAESIVSYVNSTTFIEDMEQANVDINEIARDLYRTYNMEPQPGENSEKKVPYMSPIQRMTLGIEDSDDLHIQDEMTRQIIAENEVKQNMNISNQESDGENSSLPSE